MTNHSNAIPSHDGFARLLQAGETLWRGVLAFHRAMQVARARQELHSLSDHTLKDIGLTRRQIDTLFR